MTRGVQGLQAQPANHQQVTAFEAQIDKGRWARAVHDDRRIQLTRQLPCRRKVIRVRMGVDEVTESQAVYRSIWLSSGSISAAAHVSSQPTK
jgi:hypothetical protein